MRKAEAVGNVARAGDGEEAKCFFPANTCNYQLGSVSLAQGHTTKAVGDLGCDKCFAPVPGRSQTGTLFKGTSQISILNCSQVFPFSQSPIFIGWPPPYTVAHFGSLIYLGCSIN